MMAKDISVSAIIKKSRAEKGLSVREVAQRSGISEGWFSRIENDKAGSPGYEVLMKIAKGLDVPLSYLLGEEQAPKRLVPLLDWICAGDGEPTHSSLHPGHAEEYVETDLTATRVFALKVKGPSMEPLFREGETILINPDLEVQPGDFCVAKIENEESATLKQLKRIGTVFFLHPLDPSYDDIPVTKKVRIVGKVVRSQRDW